VKDEKLTKKKKKKKKNPNYHEPAAANLVKLQAFSCMSGRIVSDKPTGPAKAFG
jgi:hypothetical protein